ncbi:vacuolar protein sorting-associated protein VPS35 [Saitoella complicata NRRL Y-17804]|nr:vacuolar protein sorting-associated protein VPS35 [Saitoella complicata NRRL Y-17804]ODQ49918.1 vacuolar protein sorting-associated protein VPS35 [Saitoella complicata NRRL Y-17804]
MSAQQPPAPTPEEQARLLDEALTSVRLQSAQMRKCLDSNRLMDALKHASTALSELRSSSLGPKQYYELYMSIFDVLRYLSTYLHEAHLAGRHHLADLYELVQYAGNIVPRLYLMITVGAVYMGIPDAPVKEIMRDMMEMSRGVQHPIRGLFLRHYLSGQTRDHLPTSQTPDDPRGNLTDSTSFILTNFIEMNKLWVRLQYQGHSRDRAKRTQERRELRILVGTNLVRLSQIDGLGLKEYSEDLLPQILEQVVQCRDQLAQEYLMEVIIQVFPDEWHLRTLGQLLEATKNLGPGVDVKGVVGAMVDRLAAYAAREAEADSNKEDNVENVEQGVEKLDLNNGEEKSEGENGEKEERYRGIPVSVPLFDIFWTQITSLITARPDSLTITDISALLLSMTNLALNCYPEKLDYIDKILAYARTKANEAKEGDPQNFRSAETTNNFLGLLLAPVRGYETLLTVLKLENFTKFLEGMEEGTRRSVAAEVTRATLRSGTPIETPEDVEGVLELCKVLITDSGAQANYPQVAGKRGDSEDIIEEQGWLARMVHLFRSEDLDTQLKLLQTARKALAEGGERMRYTSPALVTVGLRLARSWKGREGVDEEWTQKAGAVYKFVHQIITALSNRVGAAAEMCFQLYIFAGQIADQGGAFEEIAYEFFAQAFVVYEESISESRAQFQAVSSLSRALQRTRHFGGENYDTLITKCALHGSKLLKKPDQCRAVYLASHLWWQTDGDAPETGTEDENGEEKKGSSGELCCVPNRVLECLQRALKIADACMDTQTSVSLFVEILDQFIYYYERQTESITPKFINGLIELCQQNIANMEPPRNEHFERTLKYIEVRRGGDDRWMSISVGH